MVQSIRLKYHQESFFTELNELAFNDTYAYERKILKEIRDNVAFHLDSNDKSTKMALSNLNLPKYELMSKEKPKIKDFYFEFADTVDLNYLIDILKDNKTEKDTVNLIFEALPNMMSKFTMAGHNFMSGLAIKMNLSAHLK